MKVAVTGVSGFIGSVTARHLTRAGHGVVGAIRSTSRVDHLDGIVDRLVEAPLEDRSTHGALLDDCDALVHNAVDWGVLRDGDVAGHYDANIVASMQLIDQAAARGLPVVLLSSVAVHHHMHDAWNGRIDATHPTRPGGLYGAAKAALEAHLWALHTSSALRFTAIRPAAVYGIDPRLERSIGWPLLERIERGEPCDRRGGGKFVHVDDVAASIVCALERDSAACGIYHLADCYTRWSDWARMAGAAMGIEPDITADDPPAPRNMFTTDDLERDLDISLTRGHEGIADHLRELVERRRAAQA